MTVYIVVSPEIGVVIPILDDGSGPTEYGCDAFLVEAPNRQTAKWMAWRKSKETRGDWWRSVHGDDTHPLRGCTVEVPRCPAEADPADWPEAFRVGI